MQAERLHHILIELLSDDEEVQYIAALTAVMAFVDQRISDPSQPAHDEALSASLKALFLTLDKSRTNKFPPTWRKTLRELDLDVLLAENIRERVEANFRDRRVDTDLKENLKALLSEINTKKGALSEIKSGFEKIELDFEKLEQGECELNIVIPRDYVDDDLKSLGKELEELEKIFKIFSELFGDDYSGFKIKTISSTDFSIVINVNVDVGLIIVSSLVALHMAFGTLQEKRDAMEKLLDLPEKFVSGIKEWANTHMEEKINELVDSFKESFADTVKEERINELKNGLVASLRKLANRLEKGFNVDVRAGLPPSIEEAEGDEKITKEEIGRMKKLGKKLNEIQIKSAELNVLELQTTKILSLPEPTEEPEEEPAEALKEPTEADQPEDPE